MYSTLIALSVDAANSVGLWWTHVLCAYSVVELLFPVPHYFIIVSCMYDYSPFPSVLLRMCHVAVHNTLPFVPLLYCSVVTHIHIFSCIRILIIILLHSDNAYRYRPVPGSSVHFIPLSHAQDVCAQRVSQCANLEFHYFNVTVRRTVPNCSAREMLLMLELQQMDRKNGDSVYLEACISGMNKYHFWNNLACNTVMKGGGREEDLISCRPNEILSPGGSSTSVSDVPTWAYVVFGILSMAVVILLLLLCVVLSVVIWCYRNNNGRANGQGR